MAVAERRLKAAIQRGAFIGAKTLPRVMGWGVAVMD